MKTKILLIIALVLIVNACGRVATETPTQKPVIVATSTFVPKSTKTRSPNSSFTMIATAVSTVTAQADVLDLKGVKPGQYVLIGDFGQEIPYLYIVSTDKQILKKLPLESYLEPDPGGIAILNADFAVSDDGTQFLIMRTSPQPSVLLDISTGQSTLLSINQDCLSASWSPDKNLIALSCLTKDIGVEIFIYDRTSRQISQVTDCHKIYKDCSSATWSTDGHWLAYYQNDQRSGQHPRGIMIFNTSCFSNNTCMNQQLGLIKADSNPTWSLQNQLVYVQSGILSYVEIKNSQPNQIHANFLPTIGADLICNTIRRSPDGNDFACTIYNRPNSSIYRYSPGSNTFDLIFSGQGIDVNLIGWITVP